MKPNVIFSMGLALHLSALTAAHAQVPPVAPALPPVAPVPPAPPAGPAEEIHDIEHIVVRAQKQAEDEAARAHSATVKAQTHLARLDHNLFKLTSGKSARVLIIPAEEPAPETIAHLEEDLAVMARVLEKSVDGKDRHPKALGIDVLTFAGPAGAQHLYVGGHGAIFTLRVKFPLSPPARETAEDDADEDKNSTWEEARREVFGPSGFERYIWPIKDLERPSREEYDAGKVERLKESLIEALRHATHIRHLSADERVSVVITTGAMGVVQVRHAYSAGRGGGFGARAGGAGRVEEAQERSRPESVLTIQARKSDIDAFAKGEMDANEFRKKVTIMSY